MTTTKPRFAAQNLVAAATCLALCILLPYFTGQIPAIGNMLAPMHIPVLLCGFLCGWPWAAGVGFVAPLLRFAIAGMPPLMPTGLAMAFELAAYGLFTSLLYRRLPKKPGYVYVALLCAMLAGRLVWGIVSVPLYHIAGMQFTFQIFLASGFVRALPGIVCHILLIPPLVLALRRTRLVE